MQRFLKIVFGFGIFVVLFVVIQKQSAQAATVCSDNTHQACSYTSGCSSYASGTLCEHLVSCNGTQSQNNVYICTAGKWVYDHYLSNGTCNFCGATPTHTPTPTPTKTPTPTPTPTTKPTNTPNPTLTPTSTPQPSVTQGVFLPADVNHSGCVNLIDFNLWLQAFQGNSVPNTFPDINGDGKVDVMDFGAWLSAIQSLFSSNPNDPRLCLQ